ncbi:hypothetical protein BDQ17DRAFT_1384728, partial [Cyathus striatus]
YGYESRVSNFRDAIETRSYWTTSRWPFYSSPWAIATVTINGTSETGCWSDSESRWD